VIAYAGSATTWLPDQHETERWCRLLREQLPAIGATPALPGLLGPPPVDTTVERRTVVHCGAKSGSRRWPPQRFAAVALLLAEQGHDVVVSGGPGEEQLAEHIAAAADVPVVTGRDLRGLLALIGGARLVISGDTGVAHVAAVYSVPSVTLFGPVSPQRWGPPDSARHQVLWHGDGRGDPHGADPDPALLQISVDEVVRATGRALTADTLVLGAGVA
jgi:ADP-heptose:LPS heptosyltransferase